MVRAGVVASSTYCFVLLLLLLLVVVHDGFKLQIFNRMLEGDTYASLPPITAASRGAQLTPPEDADFTATALEELRVRLPPLRMPSPVKLRMRPAPPKLSYTSRPRQGAKEVDFMKESKAIEKTQSQQRCALEAEEQICWTRILLAHFHALAELEEGVGYQEAALREAIHREEEREYMILVVEHEARGSRIRGRALVSIQLQKHLLAIDQEEKRKALLKEESTDFAQLKHREIIYRPAMTEKMTSMLPAIATKREAGGTSCRQPHAPPRTSTHATPARSNPHQAPPPKRPINSARNEDRFVSNGRMMWGHQKVLLELQHKADNALASLPATEQFRREEHEGIELGERLGMERLFFEETHSVAKLVEQHEAEACAAQQAQREAHDLAAHNTVELVMGHIMDTVCGTYDSATPETSAAPVAASIAAAAVASVPEQQSLIVPSVNAARRRSSSVTKIVAAPTTPADSQTLIDHVVAKLTAAGSLLCAMDLVALVEDISEELFPVSTDDEAWKRTGTCALKAAQDSDPSFNVRKCVSYLGTATPVAAALLAPPAAPSANISEAVTDSTQRAEKCIVADEKKKVKEERDMRAPDVPTLVPSRPMMFPSLDVLCDSMLDGSSIDAPEHDGWRLLLSAARDAELAAASDGPRDACENIRRFLQGHRDAELSADYLYHVLWRETQVHDGVVNALELMPTRWRAYRNEKELEDEEQTEVLLAECLARGKIIREQVADFCSVMHYVGNKRRQMALV